MDYSDKTKEDLIAEIKRLQEKVCELEKKQEVVNGEGFTVEASTDTNRNVPIKKVNEHLEKSLIKLKEKDVVLKLKSEVIKSYTKKIQDMQKDIADKVELIAKANKDMQGRELRIIELKEKVSELEEQLKQKG